MELQNPRILEFHGIPDLEFHGIPEFQDPGIPWNSRSGIPDLFSLSLLFVSRPGVTYLPPLPRERGQTVVNTYDVPSSLEKKLERAGAGSRLSSRCTRLP